MAQQAASDGALIRTKLLAPVQREVILRPEALAALGAQPGRRLTLLRAPAGWGKSSLLQAWHAADAEERDFAWFALDRGDNDPVRFFAYVIEALRGLAPVVGERSVEILRAPGASLTDDVLPTLLTELEVLPGPSVLVIDDYHLIDSAEVHEGMEMLLEHLPPNLEIAISSRTEPPLPLARYRGRGQLTEVSTRELRFTSKEAEELLNDNQSLELDPAQVERLVERTEGWPAGLYLAALSLRGRAEPDQFIRDFAGDDRHLVDYLTAEVLGGQSDEMREFLLATSFLDRFNASLCDAVTGSGRSARVLREVEASNLFLVPLDDRRQWYRYHHLFGELLRNELRAGQPEKEVEVHRRAAAWMLEQGMQSEAITHLLSAERYAEAVDLIAEVWYPLGASGGQSTVQGWLDSLPREISENDVRLCVARALMAISFGRLDEVEAALDSIAAAPPAPGPFFDGFTSGPQAEKILRSAYRWLLGDLGGCRETAAAALASAEAPSAWDSLARIRLGASSYWLGDGAEGISNLELGRAGSSASSLNPAWISSLGLLAMIRLEEGEPDAARGLVAEARDAIRDAGLSEYWVGAPTRIAAAGLMIVEGRPTEAIEELNRGLKLAARGSGPTETAYGQILLGRALRLQGERDQAIRLLAEARWTIDVALDPGPVIARLLEQEEEALQVTRSSAVEAEHVEELSDRELSVLRMMSGDLSQREIGNHLYISFNTVKTHSKNIYRKLGVTQRSEAVARARRLDLL